MVIKARRKWKKVTVIDNIKYNFINDYLISNYGDVKIIYNDSTEHIMKVHHDSSITNELAHEIFKRMSEGLRNSEISKMYNISQAVVQHMRSGHTWDHIGKYYTFKRKNKGKIPQEVVHEICKLRVSGCKYKDIINDLNLYQYFPGVSQESIRKILVDIKSLKQYKHIGIIYFS